MMLTCPTPIPISTTSSSYLLQIRSIKQPRVRATEERFHMYLPLMFLLSQFLLTKGVGAVSSGVGNVVKV
jgi:hypothetical protein